MVFPKLKNKHAKAPMFTPKDFLKYQRSRGRYPKFKPPKGVIFCYSRRLLGYILKNHNATKTKWFCDDFYLLNEAKNQIGIIANFGIGAPVAVTLLEELIAFGVKKFVSIGEAGALQRHLKIGDIVVCNKALRDEGTSYHYLKHTRYAYASREMTEKIRKTLEKLNQKYTVGASWTTDAPYRETVAEARQYQKEGIATVEMEAAGLFAVAQYRKADIGAIFIVSDSLAGLRWKPKFHLTGRGGWKILFKLAKEVLLTC
jgi:nucleoside phosphorylase